MRKKIFGIMCVTLCLIFVFGAVCIVLADEPPVPAADLTISAPSAVLIDNATGQVIYEKDPDTPMPLAGVTKVASMTLFFEAIENGKLQLKDNVSISRKAAGMGGSQAFLDAGESYAVETLLKAVVVANANDACVALAEAISGSEEIFVGEMNAKAQEWGMTNTAFINATGLYAEGHVSTVRDMALASQQLVRHKQLFEYSGTWMDSITHTGNRVSELTNGNKLVKTYAGCDGLATGSDDKAGYCISASAMRGNLRLITVIFGDRNNRERLIDAQALLDYGFANYVAKRIYKKGDTIKKDIPIKSGQKRSVNGVTGGDYSLLLEKGQERAIKKEILIDEDLAAPITAGQKIGTVVIVSGDTELLRVDILASEDVEKIDFTRNFISILERWLLGA